MSEGLTHADIIGNMNRIADQFQSWSEEAVKANQKLEVMDEITFIMVSCIFL